MKKYLLSFISFTAGFLFAIPVAYLFAQLFVSFLLEEDPLVKEKAEKHRKRECEAYEEAFNTQSPEEFLRRRHVCAK